MNENKRRYLFHILCSCLPYNVLLFFFMVTVLAAADRVQHTAARAAVERRARDVSHHWRRRRRRVTTIRQRLARRLSSIGMNGRAVRRGSVAGVSGVGLLGVDGERHRAFPAGCIDRGGVAPFSAGQRRGGRARPARRLAASGAGVTRSHTDSRSRHRATLPKIIISPQSSPPPRPPTALFAH